MLLHGVGVFILSNCFRVYASPHSHCFRLLEHTIKNSYSTNIAEQQMNQSSIHRYVLSVDCLVVAI